LSRKNSLTDGIGASQLTKRINKWHFKRINRKWLILDTLDTLDPLEKTG